MALEDLRFSPVNDVINRGETILDGNAIASDKRFAYLLRYLMFRSCIGVRIEDRHSWKPE